MVKIGLLVEAVDTFCLTGQAMHGQKLIKCGHIGHMCPGSYDRKLFCRQFLLKLGNIFATTFKTYISYKIFVGKILFSTIPMNSKFQADRQTAPEIP